MLKIGLTGGIGSGKSQVAGILAELGASIIDTDVIAHQLTAANGQAIPLLVQAFGQEIIGPDGAMDRVRVRQMVFDDANSRRMLEGIIHPLIAQEVGRAAQEATGCYVVFVVPLLVESGRWLDRVDRVCVVDCDRQTQIDRVQLRSQLPLAQIEQILQAQASRQARLKVAHDVILNDHQTQLHHLRLQVLGLHQRWCNLAA
jgi:dephospho-CoA kinase